MATLKVRVRAATGGATLKVQLPPPCTLQALKDAIASQIGQPASSFHVSLNKKHPIDGPSNALLPALGVINGDLLFFIPSTGDLGHISALSNVAPESLKVSRNATPQSTPTSLTSSEDNLESPVSSLGQGRSVDPVSLRRELCAAAALQRTSNLLSAGNSQESRTPQCENLDKSPRSASEDSASPSHSEERIKQRAKGKLKMDCSMDSSMSGGEATQIEIEEEGIVSPIQKSRCSLPDLLQRVLLVEYANAKNRQAVLVLAIHAVMLESGFVLRQPMGVVGSSDGCGLAAGWSGKGGPVNLTYTLPEIIRAESLGGQNPAVGNALLRCHVVGNALVVYGVVTGGQSSEIYRLELLESRYLHKDLVVEDDGNAGDALKVMTNLSVGGKQDTALIGTRHRLPGLEETPSMYCNVFELWQQVKDNLSLPLLTCICVKAGLQPPASLLMLPTEMKIKVLENLPAAALATISCVCSELKFLAASDELWKVRFKKEFGWPDTGRAPGGHGWKTAFARELARRRTREEERREAERQLRAETFPALIAPPLLVPPLFPGILGGDYDRFPGLGGGAGFRPRGPPGGAFWDGDFLGGMGDTDRFPPPGGRQSCEIGGLGQDIPSSNMMRGRVGISILDDLLPAPFFGRDSGSLPPGN